MVPPASITPGTSKLPTQVFTNADSDNDTNIDDYLVFTYRPTKAAADNPNTTLKVTYAPDIDGWLTPSDGVDTVVIVHTEDGVGGTRDQEPVATR